MDVASKKIIIRLKSDQGNYLAVSETDNTNLDLSTADSSNSHWEFIANSDNTAIQLKNVYTNKYSPVHKCWPKTHPCYPRALTAFLGIKKKKIQMANSKKLRFSKPSIPNIFAKLSKIGPWISNKTDTKGVNVTQPIWLLGLRSFK